MRLWRAAAIVLAGASLGACALLGMGRTLPPAPLLAPAALGQHVQITQKVTVHSGEERQSFLAAWLAAPDRLDLAGLSPSGQRLLTLSWDGEQFREDYSPMLDRELPGRQVLSQLQLAHWPLDGIRQSLTGSPWRLEQTLQGEYRERHLYFRGTAILSIVARMPHDGAHSLPATISIRSHLAAYRLEVETLQVQVVSQ